MGKVNVKVALKNYDDIAVINRGLMSPEKAREYRGEGLVDTGATMLTIPMDLYVDCKEGKLVPRSESPDMPVIEIL